MMNSEKRLARPMTLRQRMRAFLDRENGTVTIESVIILPILFFAIMACYSYFDGYRKKSLALKANYSISDYLSRVDLISATSLEGLDETFEYLSRTPEESWIRVTVVTCAQDCDDRNARRLDMVFSRHSAGSSTYDLSQAEMRTDLAQHIPRMYQGEHLTIVESVARYEPVFPGPWTGIYQTDMYDIIVTSNRFVPSLNWSNL